MTQPEVSFSFSIRVTMKRACRCFYVPASCSPRRTSASGASVMSAVQSTHMPVVRLHVPRRHIICPIFVQCYVMGRFGHENGPFWMLAGAVLVLFFLPLGPFWSGPFWFAWAVLAMGRFGRIPTGAGIKSTTYEIKPV